MIHIQVKEVNDMSDFIDINKTFDFEKCFELQPDKNEQNVAYALAQYLDTKMNMITQTMHTSEGYVVQCKGDANAEWTKYIGMDAAVTITLRTQEGLLYVKVGTGKWIQKLGIAAVGSLWFAPLAVMAGIGAVRQAAIPQQIFGFISEYLQTEGQSVNREEETVYRTIRTCPSCGEAVGQDDVFCHKCGSKIEVELPKCSDCGRELEGTEAFCPSCGKKLM